MSNHNEWLARTDPGSAASWFRVTQVARSGNILSVTFPTVTGRNYQLQSSPNLANPWTDVSGAATTGNNGNRTVQVDVTGIPSYFFHVSVGGP